MGADAFSALFGCNPADSILDALSRMPYDRLIEIDAKENLCRSLFCAEGQFAVPVCSGAYGDLFAYAQAHLVHPMDQAACRALLSPEKLIPAVLSGASRAEKADLRIKTPDGGWRWAAHLVVYGPENGLEASLARLYIFDIQALRERKPGESAVLSSPAPDHPRDELTGLLTENPFFELAQEKLGSLEGAWCVVHIDIEHYKLFTDWYGLDTGRKLLASFGGILREAAHRQGGLAGYRGQDDFCLMIPYDRPMIDELYQRLRYVLVSLGCSIGFSPLFGVCMIDGSSDQILEIINHAALTAESIKGNFQRRIQIYDPAQHSRSAEEYRMLIDFQNALENGEITFWLQPQCRVSSGKVVGAESLARWIRPDGTQIPPATFVPLLEKYGMVSQLDQYIWEAVCAWLRSWVDRGHHILPISLNVSRVDVFTMDVPGFLSALVKKYGLPAGALKIEITESAWTVDAEKVIQTIESLRRMGFLVFMDDFGSGYSSLNMLRSLHVDVIKLDAQFLSINEQEERKGVGILESVVNMAKTMSTPIIVEGVESREQVQFLSDLGCRYMQGFYFHRPMPVSDFEALLADESHADFRGIEFKANEQIHVREFLDSNVYSDAMLNNILGPVAFYQWKDGNVDIVRYNQQFYQMVGLEIDLLNQRKTHIQNYLYPADREKLFGMLERAYQDRLNGAKGIVRVYKPNNAMVWISLKVYFLEEDSRGRRFCASAQDVTELQYINVNLPGAYFRCAESGGFAFHYISRNYLELTGYSLEEIRTQFQNQLLQMVHPKDRDLLISEAEDQARGSLAQVRPFRIRRKQGDYIYCAAQGRLTDLFGAPCWQCMLIDVTEVMRLRNQMRLLAKYSSGSIVFLRRGEKGPEYEVAVHGLEEMMGLNSAAFEAALTDGTFASWIQPGDDSPFAYLNDPAYADVPDKDYRYTVRLPGGRSLIIRTRFDHIEDEKSSVDYIVSFRAL